MCAHTVDARTVLVFTIKITSILHTLTDLAFTIKITLTFTLWYLQRIQSILLFDAGFESIILKGIFATKKATFHCKLSDINIGFDERFSKKRTTFFLQKENLLKVVVFMKGLSKLLAVESRSVAKQLSSEAPKS